MGAVIVHSVPWLSDGIGGIFLAEIETFFSLHSVPNGYVSRLFSYPLDTAVISSGIKRPGPEADYSHPSSAENKNARSCGSIDIAMGYWMYGRNSISSKGKIFFTTPQHPDRLWGPLSLLFDGYLENYPLR
jgi:hypothetical protein